MLTRVQSPMLSSRHLHLKGGSGTDSETEPDAPKVDPERAADFWKLLAGEMKKVDEFAQQEIQRINSWHHVLKEQVKEMKAQLKLLRRRNTASNTIQFSQQSPPPVRETAVAEVAWYKGLCSRHPDKVAADKLRIAMEESYVHTPPPPPCPPPRPYSRAVCTSGGVYILYRVVTT